MSVKSKVFPGFSTVFLGFSVVFSSFPAYSQENQGSFYYQDKVKTDNQIRLERARLENEVSLENVRQAGRIELENVRAANKAAQSELNSYYRRLEQRNKALYGGKK